MAFTSDMIPRLVYLYTSNPHGAATMEGYINQSLSVYEISKISLANQPEREENPSWFNESIITTCRYVAFVAIYTLGTASVKSSESNTIAADS